MIELNDPNFDFFASFSRLDFLEKRSFKRDRFFCWSYSTILMFLSFCFRLSRTPYAMDVFRKPKLKKLKS